ARHAMIGLRLASIAARGIARPPAHQPESHSAIAAPSPHRGVNDRRVEHGLRASGQDARRAGQPARGGRRAWGDAAGRGSVTHVNAPGRAIALLGLLLASAACSKTVLDPRDYAAGAMGTTPVETPADGRGATVARIATAYLGAPYVWSGASPSGFDCSGLVTYVYSCVGITIPHNAAQQLRDGTAVPPAALAP